jgi:hypothetical protein
MRPLGEPVLRSGMELPEAPSKIFLLSPANAAGIRARQLASPRAAFTTALRLRSAEGLPIGEAFSFMSGLYFRGKLTYARRFAAGDQAAAPDGSPAAILVIAPGFGLVPPDWPLTVIRWRKLARTPVDPARRSYSAPLRRDAGRLAECLPRQAGVVLLGSIATGKYLDLLRPIFGDRLLFPRLFAGTGDMRRGALMLRAARSGEELEYASADPGARLQARGNEPASPSRRQP